MHAEDLHEVASQRAAELPATDMTHPFGEDWDVWKVRGKVFMLQTEVTGTSQVILKVDPFDGEVLRSQHGEVEPGYHMNKKHWISVYPGESVDKELLRDLVTESYTLVIEQLPHRDRPADPVSFRIE